MNTTWNYTITNTPSGFRRFISTEIFYINIDVQTYSDKYYDSEERVARYVQAVHYKQLYDVFIASLTDEEEQCVNYIRYHDPITKRPENFYICIDNAYLKWKRIFFTGAFKQFKNIDSKLLGIAMRTIRKSYKKSITTTAEILGTDRVTLSHYEHGRRIPSLNFMSQFCMLFNISLDTLMKVSRF